MICDSCGQPIDPDESALRRVIWDDIHIRPIGQWQWHRDCPPAGPESDYDEATT